MGTRSRGTYINTRKVVEMESSEFINNEKMKHLISCSYFVKFLDNPLDKQYFSTALKIQVIFIWCCVFHELPKAGKGCGGVLWYVYCM